MVECGREDVWTSSDGVEGLYAGGRYAVEATRSKQVGRQVGR